MQITDEQAKIIGREIGNALADKMNEIVKRSVPYGSWSDPMTILVQELGRSIGASVKVETCHERRENTPRINDSNL